MTLEFHPSVALGLAASTALSGAGPIAVALIFARRTGASLRYFGIGALVFVVSQVVLRLPWQIPLGIWLAPRLKGHELLGYAWVAFSAMGAALFEEIGRWVGYRRLVRDERSWRVGVMYGLGHGGIEAMLLVGLSLMVTLVLYLLLGLHAPLPIEADKLAKIEETLGKMTFTGSLAGGVERILAVTFHVAQSLLVLQCFTRGQRRWLLYAVGLHFACDSVGVIGAQWLARHAGGPLAGELAIVPFAGIGLGIISKTRASHRGAAGESRASTR